MSRSIATSTLCEIIGCHKIILPSSFSLLLRTLIDLEGTARRLSPTFSLAEVFRPFYTTMVHRRVSVRGLKGRLQHAYRGWERLAQALPRDLSEVLTRVRNGTFSVHLDIRRIDPVVNRLVLGIMTAALLVSSALLWSMKAPPMICGVSVFGGAGYLMAAYLGWRLVRAIKKSGDITRSNGVEQDVLSHDIPDPLGELGAPARGLPKRRIRTGTSSCTPVLTADIARDSARGIC